VAHKGFATGSVPNLGESTGIFIHRIFIRVDNYCKKSTINSPFLENGDQSCHNQWQGPRDATTIIDACTKELLAWVLSGSLEIDFVLETVNHLIKEHGISLTAKTLIHSDQGSHYTSVRFIRLI
jgi:hypothetical protein